MTITKTLWDMDVRVRERNLKAGVISQDDVARMLEALPDVADLALPLDVAQPAVGSEGAVDQPQGEGDADPA